MHSYVHCSVIHSSQDTETTYMSINRCMDKEDAAHIYHGIPHYKKERNNAICSNIDGLRDYHTKGSNQKDKYCMTSLTCGI